MKMENGDKMAAAGRGRSRLPLSTTATAANTIGTTALLVYLPIMEISPRP